MTFGYYFIDLSSLTKVADINNFLAMTLLSKFYQDFLRETKAKIRLKIFFQLTDNFVQFVDVVEQDLVTVRHLENFLEKKI